MTSLYQVAAVAAAVAMALVALVLAVGPATMWPPRPPPPAHNAAFNLRRPSAHPLSPLVSIAPRLNQ